MAMQREILHVRTCTYTCARTQRRLHSHTYTHMHIQATYKFTSTVTLFIQAHVCMYACNACMYVHSRTPYSCMHNVCTETGTSAHTYAHAQIRWQQLPVASLPSPKLRNARPSYSSSRHCWAWARSYLELLRVVVHEFWGLVILQGSQNIVAGSRISGHR